MKPRETWTVGIVAGALLLAGPARAQEREPDPGPASLRRRMEAAEARIAALERLVERQAVQLAAYQLRSAEAPPRRVEAGTSPPIAQAEPPGAAGGRQEAPPSALEAPPGRPMTHQMVSLTFNGLVQAWYAAGNAALRDTFRIRRTEVYFTGEITKKARWQVMVDPAKALSLEAGGPANDGSRPLTAVGVNQASRILQNAVITFDYVPKAQVSVGQFKLPLSLEGRQSSGRLETVERALFLADRARAGSYGDVRDLGLLVRGGLGARLAYEVGVFNGIAQSQNDVDADDQKALAGSLAWRPGEGVHLGASGAWAGTGPGRPRRDRLGAELQVARGPFTVKSELMTGHDGPLSRRGYYAHAGWRPVPKLEAVFRVDAWDPDTGSESSPASLLERDYVAGVNVFLSQHNLKLQANYVRKTFPHGGRPGRNVFLVNSQTFW